MKGLKCTTYRKLFITLALLFVPLFGLFVGSNAGAISKDFDSFLIRYATSSSAPYQASNWLGYGTSDTLTNHTPSFYKFDRVASRVTNVSVPSGNNNLVFTEKWNFVVYCLANYSSSDYYGGCPEVYGAEQYLFSVSINGTAKEFISDNVNLYITDWACPSPTVSGAYLPCRTFTFQASAVVRDVSGTINNINVNVEFPGSVAIPSNTTTSGYFEQSDSNLAIFDFLDASGTITNDILQQQLQNQNLQLQALENLNISINQQAQQDSQDREDLQNQSDDSQDSADTAADNLNNAKTGLFSVIANFVNIVIHPPADNCVIDADMGNMDLGDIDLCQLSLPPAFAVIGTLLIIGFLIPLGYSVISTILSLLKGATQD